MDKIPAYDAMADAHCRNFAETVKNSNKLGMRRKANVLLAPGGLRVARNESAQFGGDDSPRSGIQGDSDYHHLLGPSKMKMGNERRRPSNSKTYGLVPRKKGQMSNLISPETISALQEEIEYYWNVYRIDSYYTSAYMDCLAKLHITTYIQLLAKEIENLRNEKAAIQRLYITIQKREESLGSVSELAQYLASGPSSHPPNQFNPSNAELVTKVI